MCSFDADPSYRTEERVTPGSCSVSSVAHSSLVSLGSLCSSVVSHVHSNVGCAAHSAPAVEPLSSVSSEPSRDRIAHSSKFRFCNYGRPHNRGTASVIGMRRMPARACLFPLLCRPCGRPNSCGVVSAPTFARLAPDPSPASVAGGALAVVEHAHHGTHNVSAHSMHDHIMMRARVYISP